MGLGNVKNEQKIKTHRGKWDESLVVGQGEGFLRRLKHPDKGLGQFLRSAHHFQDALSKPRGEEINHLITSAKMNYDLRKPLKLHTNTQMNLGKSNHHQ